MLLRPDLGFHDEGHDLSSATFYADACAPFGTARVLSPISVRSLRFSMLEDETIWTRDWVVIGCEKQIPNDGDLLPFTVGNHGIHVQRQDGGLTGRFNKAQHGGCRAIPLQCRTGKKTKCSFTSCGYSRDREVIPASDLGDATPEMEQYLGLRPERLLNVQTFTFGPMILVNLDVYPSPIGDTLQALDQAGGFFTTPQPALSASWLSEFDANWKLLGKHLSEGEIARSTVGSDSQADSDAGIWRLVHGAIHGQPVTFAWLFPNLVLIRAGAETCAIVLQPTALGQTMCRCFVFNSSRDDAAAFWRSEIERRAAAAVEEHLQLSRWGTSFRPETIGAAMPLQTSQQGHWMQRMLAERAVRAPRKPFALPIFQQVRG